MALSVPLLKQLLSPPALYFVSYAWVFGQTVWMTFFGGIIAHRALPRQQFGALQAKTFPVYFRTSLFLSATLLAYWVHSHPPLIAHLWQPSNVDVAQFYVLLSVIFHQGINYFYIGPLTNKLTFARHKLERSEGKPYSDPEASSEMKSLNRQFGIWHGISSLANLFAFLGLLFHGLWIGAFGLR